MTDPVGAARAAGRTRLGEAEAKRLLADAGVAVPAFREVATADAAVEAAEELGFPVVAKVASPAVAHKSEWGGGAGVALGLDDSAAVREAARRILDVAADEGIEAGVIVEAAADLDAGTEVIVGGVRKPAFGPTVLVGLGGVFAEVLGDVSHRLAPVNRREARSMVDELQGAPLLSGARGRPPADLDALADVVVAVGDLLDRRGELAEIDVNPVLATAEGAVALDALVVLEADAAVDAEQDDAVDGEPRGTRENP